MRILVIEDDQRVARQLQIEQPAVVLDEGQRKRPQDRQRVGQADQKKEGIDGERAGRRDLREGGGAQQQRADDFVRAGFTAYR